MEPLQELQCEGFLLSVDVRSVFGNLEELCKVVQRVKIQKRTTSPLLEPASIDVLSAKSG